MNRQILFFLTIILILFIIGITGCMPARYLLQAGRGQMELFNKARPLSEVIKNPRTSPQVRSLLEEVAKIKSFGEENGLKATTNYQEYIEINRPSVVWIVSACQPLKFLAKEWNFPLVGSFPYLGWFHHEDAKNYAQELKHAGWDVDVRGASAYSTLGWFRDPVLSTMISSGKEALGELINVVLHESVHATLYIENQSFFNESLANFIADRLTESYFRKIKPQSNEERAYFKNQSRSQEIQKLFHQTYLNLAQIYESKIPDPEKLILKGKILKDLQTKIQWNRNLNNATLIQYKTYYSGEEIFEKLFQKCEFNIKKLLTLLKQLKPQNFSKPQDSDLNQALKSLFL